MIKLQNGLAFDVRSHMFHHGCVGLMGSGKRSHSLSERRALNCLESFSVYGLTRRSGPRVFPSPNPRDDLKLWSATIATASASKVCWSCGSTLPPDAIFCSGCGAYQGQHGMDEGAGTHDLGQTPAVGNADLGGVLRRCPHCGTPNHVIALACTNCFKPLPPVPATERATQHLPKPSRALVWTLVALSVLAIVLWALLELVLAALMATGHHQA
jgi:hypothetical protein